MDNVNRMKKEVKKHLKQIYEISPTGEKSRNNFNILKDTF